MSLLAESQLPLDIYFRGRGKWANHGKLLNLAAPRPKFGGEATVHIWSHSVGERLRREVPRQVGYGAGHAGVVSLRLPVQPSSLTRKNRCWVAPIEAHDATAVVCSLPRRAAAHAAAGWAFKRAEGLRLFPDDACFRTSCDSSSRV